MKLFLDDKRDPPDNTWVVVRTADAAIYAIKELYFNHSYNGSTEPFEAMMFDHDLGHCESCTTCEGWKDPCGCRCHLTGYFVVCWLETEGIWPINKPTCHSQNPVGRAKIEAAINREHARRGGVWKP